MAHQVFPCPLCGQLNTTRRKTCKNCRVAFSEIRKAIKQQSNNEPEISSAIRPDKLEQNLSKELEKEKTPDTEILIDLNCPKCGIETEIQKLAVGYRKKCKQCGEVSYYKKKDEDFSKKPDRILCSDASCTGVLRNDGSCGMCGRYGARGVDKKDLQGSTLSPLLETDFAIEKNSEMSSNKEGSKADINKCPYCAEEIKAQAIKCKHCGEWLGSEAINQSQFNNKIKMGNEKTLSQKESNDMPLDQSKNFFGGSYHPWRRFFARSFEYAIIVPLLLFIFSILLIYLFPQIKNDYLKAINNPTIAWLALYWTCLLYIPIEAGFLSATGTTPVKSVFGIRVLKRTGHKLSYPEALQRSVLVWIKGEGFGIPIVIIITRLYSYFRLTGTGTTPWDVSVDSFVSHRSWGVLRIFGIFLITMIFLLIMTILRNL